MSSEYSDTLAWLYGLEVERMDLKLDRTAAALRAVGAPQQRFPSIHIAGTNGKGSTAAFLHAMIGAAGYRVGLFTSPHLIDFCERIRLGARRISPQEVVDGVAALRDRLEPAGIRLTPFEMMSVLAFDAFARAEVDVAVVEVGLGGRLDATNVLTPLASVITGIGLDHQQYLGDSLADIAREKGGIIKPRVPVVLGPLDPDSRAVLTGIARTSDSPVFIYGRDFGLEDEEPTGDPATSAYRGPQFGRLMLRPGLAGRFQARNAALAVACLETVHPTFPVSPAQVRAGVQAVDWPGRLQVVSTHPLVILDGAHNAQAIDTLLSELTRLAAGRRLRFLFGAMHDKDWRPMLAAVERAAAEVVVTAVAQPRAEDPETLYAALSGTVPARIVRGAADAFRDVVGRAAADDAVVVCGSLFLVGEVLAGVSDATVPGQSFPAQAAAGS